MNVQNTNDEWVRQRPKFRWPTPKAFGATSRIQRGKLGCGGTWEWMGAVAAGGAVEWKMKYMWLCGTRLIEKCKKWKSTRFRRCCVTYFTLVLEQTAKDLEELRTLLSQINPIKA